MDEEKGLIIYNTPDGRTKVALMARDGNNKFTVTATGQEPSTTYFFKSYVQNGMAVKYGSVKSFTTKESTISAGSVDLGIVMTRKDGTSCPLHGFVFSLGVLIFVDN